ncbi:MAG: hypothetical protein BGO63_17615 [Candidatus Accumulibacter sp. 66-26]|nr:formate dehydrogenase [Accumulibacter sp.]OJW49696.1 MAG: hypothetical protein BGO63_17615 [Candidatus Accumulibacter sp. 66-26]
MDNKQAKPARQANLKRRSFLLTLGAGSAGAAAVVVGGTPNGGAAQAVQQALAEPEQGQGQGYALSEHVRNYYRTTRV